MDPLFDFTGKIVLVTGGSRGLGLQMVRAFAERGADVIIASRKLDACEAVAQEVRAMGRRAMAFSAHAAKWDEIDRLIEAAYAEFGRIDILVNNAGMSPAMPSHEVTEELFDKVIGLNFKGPFRLASQIGKRMFDGEGGVIIRRDHAAAFGRPLWQFESRAQRDEPLAGQGICSQGAGQHAVRRPVPDRHSQGLDGRNARDQHQHHRPAGAAGRSRDHGARLGQSGFKLYHRSVLSGRRRLLIRDPGAYRD